MGQGIGDARLLGRRKIATVSERVRAAELRVINVVADDWEQVPQSEVCGLLEAVNSKHPDSVTCADWKQTPFEPPAVFRSLPSIEFARKE